MEIRDGDVERPKISLEQPCQSAGRAPAEQAGEPSPGGAPHQLARVMHVKLAHTPEAKRRRRLEHLHVPGNAVEELPSPVQEQERDVVPLVKLADQVEQGLLHPTDMHVVVYEQNMHSLLWPPDLTYRQPSARLRAQSRQTVLEQLTGAKREQAGRAEVAPLQDVAPRVTP